MGFEQRRPKGRVVADMIQIRARNIPSFSKNCRIKPGFANIVQNGGFGETLQPTAILLPRVMTEESGECTKAAAVLAQGNILNKMGFDLTPQILGERAKNLIAEIRNRGRMMISLPRKQPLLAIGHCPSPSTRPQLKASTSMVC